ncbi:protein translocase subunit SecD [Vibrio sp. 99-70-13A1]|uniref:protein translocase subunit SecD n=1 Tax=Vibrio sp. 99-70-13A1 TaxID=2607601 RepID=UPI001493D1A2|nr:protein translocase subunit SecD [Vibrio sp. 99-70-13A1]NOH98390.1 protein translocase subunit SecD [Vibrio sp. 99-70-13A1]
MKKIFAYFLLILLLISAVPSFFGEKPALVLNHADSSVAIEPLLSALVENQITPLSVENQQDETTLIFENKKEQREAQQVLSLAFPLAHSHFSFVSAAPQLFSQVGLTPINLGLDLRGGVQFMLQVEIDDSVKSLVEATSTNARHVARAEGIRSRIADIDNNGFSVIITNLSSRDSNSIQNVTDHMRSQFSEWKISINDNVLRFTLDESIKEEQASLAMQQTLNIMRQRIESLGITEAVTQRQGADRILIELPGVQDPQVAKRVIGATATISFHTVVDSSQAAQTHTTRDGESVRLSRQPVLTGEYIIGASASVGEFGQPEVNLVLSSAGGSKMSDFSRSNIGKPMATLYSEYHQDHNNQLVQRHEVINIATIQSQLGSRFRITGIGQISDAQDLALILRSGSLTIPVTIIDEQVIGPSLGEENIQKGLLAVLVGLALTFVSMLVLYRKFGVIACAALIANIVMIVGFLALIPGATLTLPGIAGLVLTMGMAVDTNVLVFERIKEEMRAGRSLASAIPRGYKEARSTIIDANLTSLITAIILFAIGYGAVKGFAITLGIGLLTSMFTGLLYSQMWMTKLWGHDNDKA